MEDTFDKYEAWLEKNPKGERESLSRRVTTRISNGIRDLALPLFLLGMIGMRAGEHKLRQAASTRPVLQETFKTLDLVNFVSGTGNPVFPPNFYQWHMDNSREKLVPYPYQNWDPPQAPLPQKN